MLPSAIFFFLFILGASLFLSIGEAIITKMEREKNVNSNKSRR